MNKSNESKIAKDLLCDASCYTCRYFAKWLIRRNNKTLVKETVSVCTLRVRVAGCEQRTDWNEGFESFPNKDALQNKNGYCEEYDVLEKERT